MASASRPAAGKALSSAKLQAIEDSISAKRRELARQDRQRWLGLSNDQRMIEAATAAAQDLQASPGAIQLTITLYLVGMAIGQLIYGPLSDRFGRRPVLLIGMVVYTIASVFSALAHSIEAKVFGGARVMRGFTHSEVGSDNINFALDYLQAQNIPITASDLGDTCPRKLYFFPESGRVKLRRLHSDESTRVIREEQEYRQRIIHEA